jgi:Rieske Fe-S protein
VINYDLTFKSGFALRCTAEVIMSHISRREALVALGALGLTGCLPVRDNPGESLQAGGVQVGTLTEFPSVGSYKNVDLGGTPAIVTRVASPDPKGVTASGVSLVAYSKVCTHVGCVVGDPVQGELGCACHGSIFSLNGGAVKQGPAGKPLATFKLEVRGQDIYAVP